MNQVITGLCPECNGEGYFIYPGGPGYFSKSLEAYVPEEAYRACERCGGYGEIELEPEGEGEMAAIDDFDDDFGDIELPFEERHEKRGNDGLAITHEEAFRALSSLGDPLARGQDQKGRGHGPGIALRERQSLRGPP